MDTTTAAAPSPARESSTSEAEVYAETLGPAPRQGRKATSPIPAATQRKLIAFGGYGGRFSDLGWLLPLLPTDGVQTFVEPFGGSAAVLLNRQPSPVEVYNDLDGELVNLFRQLREKTDELQKAISLAPFSRDEFALALEPVDPETVTELERARRFFVRARRSRTGLAQTATLGRWANCRTDSRRGVAAAVSRWLGSTEGLSDIAERLLKVQIENRPAIDLIRTYNAPGTLFYVDPPYLHETRGDTKNHGFEMRPRGVAVTSPRPAAPTSVSQVTTEAARARMVEARDCAGPRPAPAHPRLLADLSSPLRPEPGATVQRSSPAELAFALLAILLSCEGCPSLDDLIPWSWEPSDSADGGSWVRKQRRAANDRAFSEALPRELQSRGVPCTRGVLMASTYRNGYDASSPRVRWSSLRGFCIQLDDQGRASSRFAGGRPFAPRHGGRVSARSCDAGRPPGSDRGAAGSRGRP